MLNKSIGIAITVHGIKHFESLHNAISSILNQPYQNWKLFVVSDDPSIDHKEYFKLFDQRIFYSWDGENRGVSYRWNEAIDKIYTDYFMMLGADDWYLPNVFTFISQKNIQNWAYANCFIAGKFYSPGAFNYLKLKKKNYIPAGACIYRSEIIRNLKFNTQLTFAEDWELNLILGYHFKPNYLIDLIVYEHTLSQSHWPLAKTLPGKLYRRIKNRLNQRKFRRPYDYHPNFIQGQTSSMRSDNPDHIGVL